MVDNRSHEIVDGIVSYLTKRGVIISRSLDNAYEDADFNINYPNDMDVVVSDILFDIIDNDDYKKRVDEYEHILINIATDINNGGDTEEIVQEHLDAENTKKISIPEFLPRELLFDVMMRLDINSINALCRTDRYLRDWCSDKNEVFWKARYKRDFGALHVPTTWKGLWKAEIIRQRANVRALRRLIEGAVTTGNVALYRTLHELGVIESSGMRDSFFDMIGTFGYLSLLKYIVEEQQYERLVRIVGSSSILSLAIKNGHVDIVRYLHENGGISDGIPLRYEILKHPELVEYPFSSGLIDLKNERDYYKVGDMALDALEEKELTLDMLKYLMGRGLTIEDINDMRILKSFKYKDYNEISLYLLQFDGLNKKIALSFAAHGDNMEMVQRLLKLGTSIDTLFGYDDDSDDSDNRSYLIEALAGNGAINMIKYLTELGIDYDIRIALIAALKKNNRYIDSYLVKIDKIILTLR